ncbi:MAG: hypothetical protein KTR15_09725 [Phycisphaeraceae bacterium]|nr:hypothetical protein [Phycisphaeraceae bacterium]
MSVYHFTFHAFGTWLPDRPEGYYKHDSGWKPPSEEGRKQYSDNMQGQPIAFNQSQQQQLIDEAIKAQPYQQITLYAAATDSTHLHAIVTWGDDRDPTRIRAELKSSLTRSLNAKFGKHQWFVAKAGQNRVFDQEHLYDLVHDYLPKHTLYWFYKSVGTENG